MSSRRLLLEGSDLPALVRRAQELGGQVVRAHQLRKGLFGRRWYEVTVDVPDDDVAPVVPLSPRRRARGPGRVAPSARPAGPAAARARPAGLEDLLAAAEAAESAERSASAHARAARAASSRRHDGR